LLLDSYDLGTRQFGALGRTHDWSLSRRIVDDIGIPVILAGGLGPDNVAAAIAGGMGHSRVILRHILPNTLAPVVARAPADVGLILITMAALSYIGFGPGPYVPEWGSLVAAGQAYIFQAPWLVIFPGAAIFLTSLSLNLVGDWARDAFDPRLRN